MMLIVQILYNDFICTPDDLRKIGEKLVEFADNVNFDEYDSV